jgi:glycosyltransferase involved in cell wall biosynthesis
MYEVLTNKDLRKELSKKGIERAKLFSWKKCAEETLKVYESLQNIN